MDSTIEQVANYVAGLTYDVITPASVGACKLRLTDTIGCALGAYHSEPVSMARSLAARATAARGSCVIGSAQRVLPELAAFANGLMVRYLDGNDTFPGGGGHPSDVVAPALAIAQLVNADGKQTITALIAAYEIYQAFYRGACMRDRGLDHVFYTAVASAMAAGKLLGLGAPGLMQALALAVTPNIALHATRRGDLSMWKGCAAPNAARNGVFAALLAQQGMTGPANAIEGSHGLRELLGSFTLGALAEPGQRRGIENSNLKFFLSEYHSQSPIALALELAREAGAAEIKSITVDTYWFAWHEIGSEKEKWHPTTRESADHSLPFIVAAVLHDGAFSDAIFDDAHLHNAAIHALASKVAVNEEPAFTRDFPDKIRCRIQVVLADGRTLARESEYPRGHVNNPMTAAEVADKFRVLAQRVLPAAQVGAALSVLENFEQAGSVDALFDVLQVPPASQRA